MMIISRLRTTRARDTTTSRNLLENFNFDFLDPSLSRITVSFYFFLSKRDANLEVLSYPRNCADNSQGGGVWKKKQKSLDGRSVNDGTIAFVVGANRMRLAFPICILTGFRKVMNILRPSRCCREPCHQPSTTMRTTCARSLVYW